jgi:DNA polymerase V
VGNRIARKLNVLGIKTALDLALTNPAFIRKNFSVVLERTVRELNGESCLSLEEAPPTKQQIVCSRSFGVKITEYESLRQAICQHAERASEKLRKEHQYCRHISVFIKTSPFAVKEPYYGNVATENCLPHSGHQGHHCSRHNGSGAYLEGWAPVCQSRSYAE